MDNCTDDDSMACELAICDLCGLLADECVCGADDDSGLFYK